MTLLVIGAQMTTSHHKHSRTTLSGVVAAVVLAIALSTDQPACGFALVALIMSAPIPWEHGRYLEASDGRISLVRLVVAGSLVGVAAGSAAFAGHYAAGFAVGFLHGILG